MPVPKRKTSKSRRDKRSSTDFIRVKAFTKCSNCEHPLNPHQACMQCGFYKGRKVLVTKLERALSRGETLKAKQEKQRASLHAQQESESQNINQPAPKGSELPEISPEKSDENSSDSSDSSDNPSK